MRGTLTARTVIDRYFEGPLAARLVTAIRFGTLTDGTIGEVERPLCRRSAARMLATFLIYAENTDPATMRGSGSALWQGNQARRLGLSLRKGVNGSLGGTREAQRYLRAFVSAGVLSATQPDALNMPDRLRGKLKTSTVRGRQVATRWAYNVVRIHGWFSDALRALLVRHRDKQRPKPASDHVQRAVLDDALTQATDAAGALGAILVFLRTRPPPLY